ncbi:class I SAM-dependent methyltransferase [Nocardia puris]|uniref:class I SAM-dependent methyltransferase n=1 Tax=Nocardia puris TaxID=208602 RepID=UPI0018953C6C|nr:class I SAM-dependent methyltransferase [Nocardia puris]MBF6462501.1 class I SAM-dependent methyltransferase [Nocardia puris]
MTTTDRFRSVYRTEGVYDRLLLRHFFGGIEDTELVRRWMTDLFGIPDGALRIAEFGCGTGRITRVLAPYAHELVLADYSPTMITAVSQGFPHARTLCADTRDAVTELLSEGRQASFDVVAAFWSLSYPLGEIFETLSTSGVVPNPQPGSARNRARAFVYRMIDLLAPNGHLTVLLFDAESPEQRLVTRGWERVAPFPEGGRSYTRNILTDALRQLEERGRGRLNHTRLGGVAWAPNPAAARDWFFGVHFKHHPQLTNDPELARIVDDFIDRHRLLDGGVTLPSGVHLIDFHRADHPHASLPRVLP